MKLDNIDFYIEFISEIEKNPVLYNDALEDYRNRRSTEMVWNKIGEKFNETGANCKTKWKSIRSAFIRSLNPKSKSGSGGPKKEYYLGPYLQFLNPFTKNRHHENDQHIESYDQESQIDESSNDVHIPELSWAAEDTSTHRSEDIPRQEVSCSVPSPHTSSTSIHTPQLSKPQKHMNVADKCANEYFTPKKNKLEIEDQSEILQKNPCEMFLLSLVPHMTSMSLHQQLTFQRGVLDLIDHIKYRPGM